MYTHARMYVYVCVNKAYSLCSLDSPVAKSTIYFVSLSVSMPYTVSVSVLVFLIPLL